MGTFSNLGKILWECASGTGSMKLTSKTSNLQLNKKKSNVAKEKGERGKEKRQEVKFSDLQSPSIFINFFILYRH